MITAVIFVSDLSECKAERYDNSDDLCVSLRECKA